MRQPLGLISHPLALIQKRVRPARGDKVGGLSACGRLGRCHGLIDSMLFQFGVDGLREAGLRKANRFGPLVKFEGSNPNP